MKEVSKTSSDLRIPFVFTDMHTYEGVIDRMIFASRRFLGSFLGFLISREPRRGRRKLPASDDRNQNIYFLSTETVIAEK